MSENEKMDISIVIPCYNEEMIIEKSFAEIEETMSLLKVKYEVIFVDDGSVDSTRLLIKKICSSCENAKFVFHEKNMGRGKAVETGINMASGNIAGFLDIDLSVSAVFIPKFYTEVINGCDVVTALRVYKILEMKKLFYNVIRLFLHFGYRTVLKLMFRTSLKDTETGFKFFNRERILPLLKKVKSAHWFWDTEIMIRAYYGGYKIKEVPALYLRKPEHGSRVRIFKDVAYYIGRLFWFGKELKKK